MAKAELFQVPVLATLIRWYGAFPVQRGTSDRQAIQTALTALSQGWATGIFLPGTRTPDGRVTEPKLGAALIAAKAQVPLLPVMLWGTQHIRPPHASWPRSTPVTIRIAPPIPPPADTRRETLEQVTWNCCRILNQLHDRGR
jgi:1-acyl-sn-glycerol-3-phosphate acyltransferase